MSLQTDVSIQISLKLFSVLTFLHFSLLFFVPCATATTIIPFENLGEMAKSSNSVVMAKAIDNFEVEENGITRFYTSFAIIDNVKGNTGQTFKIRSLRLKIGDLYRSAIGEAEFKEGENYLLFLEPQDGYWQPKMMAYGVFREIEEGGESLLVPIDQRFEIELYERPDGKQVEPLGVYYKQELIKLLKEAVSEGKPWKTGAAKTQLTAEDFEEVGFRTAAPSHCTFLSPSAPYARWQNFPGTPLPVRYHVSGDPGCAAVATRVTGAISAINAGYTGVNLTNAGTHTFVPNCSSGANGSDFTSWINTNLGGSRHLLIQFNDPCNEITNLNGCSGVLAYGGIYWSTFNPHMHDGTSWYNASYGFVVVNNGVGSCQCNTGYQVMLEHEMTHALGLGHISSGFGAANMNPSCCNSISTLDIQCVNYAYTPAAVPVELIAFIAEKSNERVQLKWQTASETDNDHFEIQHSTDGRHFSPIGKAAGKGTTTEKQQYLFFHNNPNRGVNYYRLKQVDFNGDFENSPVRSVTWDSEEIEVYPNPTDGRIQVRGLPAEETEYKVTDGMGRLLKAGLIKDQALDLSGQPKGIYILTLQTGYEIFVKRIIKK